MRIRDWSSDVCSSDLDSLNVALVLPSNESVRTAVEAGAGIAALSSLVVSTLIASGKLHPLPLDLGRRPFFALRHKERYRTKAADALLELIAERPYSGDIQDGFARNARLRPE